MTDEHTNIQAFLRDYPCEAAALPAIRKAGLVPFMRHPLRYMMMMPVAEKPDLGLPEFQICKGTRMFLQNGVWRDMRGDVPEDAVLETLPETALREATEELGLKVDNIAATVALGEYRFTSATNRKEIAMWLLAAEMKEAEDFLPMQQVATSTHARRWFTLAEFRQEGRPDHAHILGLVEERLGTCV